MYIQRNLEEKIYRFLYSPEIIAIVGPRQSGKTTLMKNILAKLDQAAFLTFEDQKILRLFERATDDFIKLYVRGNKFLFIDEFQYAKNSGKILKYIFDTQKIKIFISGSSSADLTVKAIKYLVGRVLVFTLYPFNFQEFLLAKDKKLLQYYQDLKREDSGKELLRHISSGMHQKFTEAYEEYLIFGGYPRVVLEDDLEAKKEILKNIYNTYFLREVRDILGLIEDYKLVQLIKGLALQVGNLIEYRELSLLSGYSHIYLKKYLNFLEKTYICQLTRPFFRNRRKELVKSPKFYFIDTGLRNFIVEDFRKLRDRPDKGALLENGLAQELIKANYEFHFWRDKKGAEIDFIISLANRQVIAAEVKTALRRGENKNLKVFKQIYPQIETFLTYFEELEKESKREEVKNALPLYLLPHIFSG